MSNSCPALAFQAMVLDPALALPLPALEQWKGTTAQDPDLRRALNVAAPSTPPCCNAWKSGCLEVEDGLTLHCEEPFKARHHQLRTEVAPPSLRRAVAPACHTSPMAGHSRAHRAHHHLAARFWWPSLNCKTRHAASGCAHCCLANMASHKAQMQLHALSCDAPFDIMLLDIWPPGKVAE